jgi:hypothetical protein
LKKLPAVMSSGIENGYTLECFRVLFQINVLNIAQFIHYFIEFQMYVCFSFKGLVKEDKIIKLLRMKKLSL